MVELGVQLGVIVLIENLAGEGPGPVHSLLVVQIYEKLYLSRSVMSGGAGD